MYICLFTSRQLQGTEVSSNVMEDFIIEALIELDPAGEDSGEGKFTIKRMNSMSCLESKSLRLVYITNFIAPGSNYANYLKAFGVSEPKGFFQYECIDSLEKFGATSFPPQEAFYSSLKAQWISDEDYRFCQRV